MNLFGDHHTTREESHFLVCLAVKSAKGMEIHHLNEIRVDDDEIHFRADGLAGNSTNTLMDVSAMQRWFESREPWCVSAPWYGVTRSAEIEGGGTMQLNLPIVATFWPRDRSEVWLLLEEPDDGQTQGAVPKE